MAVSTASLIFPSMPASSSFAASISACCCSIALSWASMRALASDTAVSSAREMPPARSMTQDWPCLTTFTRSPALRRVEAVASVSVISCDCPSRSTVTVPASAPTDFTSP